VFLLTLLQSETTNEFTPLVLRGEGHKAKITKLKKWSEGLITCDDNNVIKIWTLTLTCLHSYSLPHDWKWCLDRSQHNVMFYSSKAFQLSHFISGATIKQGLWEDHFPECQILGQKIKISYASIDNRRLTLIMDKKLYHLSFRG